MTVGKETDTLIGDNTPGREPTVAELEALARDKLNAEQAKAAPDSDTKAGTPEVNKLKPRRQNRLLFVMVAALVGLVFIAWAGDWAYRNFLKNTPPPPDAAASPSSSNAPVQRRNDLGTGSPFKPGDSEAVTDSPDTGTGNNQRPVTAAPPSFNKTRALVSDSASPVPTQSTVLSRVNERAVNTGEPAPATAATATMKGSVTRIPFNPDLYIPENTYIPCSLQTRFVSDVAGRISCNIAEDVYSANGHTLLIEKGTKAKGVYKTGTLKAGQSRMFIVWTDLRTPDAKKISLVDTQVVGQLGEAGIDGWIDTHFEERFLNAMLLSTVSDVVSAVGGAAPSKNRNTDYTENTRAAAAEMAKVALENSINIPPTIYKNQGDIIGMLVGEDIDFSSIYTLKIVDTTVKKEPIAPKILSKTPMLPPIAPDKTMKVQQGKTQLPVTTQFLKETVQSKKEVPGVISPAPLIKTSQPAPVAAWHAESGSTLKETLFRWSATQHCSAGSNWRVIWETSLDYRIDAPLSFSGDFKAALNGIFSLYQHAQKPLYASINTSQCLIKVTDQ